MPHMPASSVAVHHSFISGPWDETGGLFRELNKRLSYEGAGDASIASRQRYAGPLLRYPACQATRPTARRCTTVSFGHRAGSDRRNQIVPKLGPKRLADLAHYASVRLAVGARDPKLNAGVDGARNVSMVFRPLARGRSSIDEGAQHRIGSGATTAPPTERVILVVCLLLPVHTVDSLDGHYVIVNGNNVSMTEETAGQRVARLRAVLSLSQQRLADLLGLSRGYLGDIEASRSEPSGQFLTALTAKTDGSADWVLTGKGPMFRGLGGADVVSEPAHPDYRVKCLLALLEDLGQEDRDAIIGEAFARASDKKQMTELRLALADLRARLPE